MKKYEAFIVMNSHWQWTDLAVSDGGDWTVMIGWIVFKWLYFKLKMWLKRNVTDDDVGGLAI